MFIYKIVEQMNNLMRENPLVLIKNIFLIPLNIFAKKDYSKISITPHGNTLLEAMAEEAVLNENLGKNISTDFLAVSFSSPDYIGHTFGSESWEQLTII
jgi:hypothetical protein